ncbi:hypothetical protein [Thiobacillus sp.]|uniref:hypothetical protein n=1 Tax=Thiobacillus sp. TaxID=924 RepID=UPI0025E46903|nr:hypothetical protein [Thiobacillus sp.]
MGVLRQRHAASHIAHAADGLYPDVVSQAGHCTYCIDMNAGMLINVAGWTPDQVAANHGARMVAGDILINGFKVERDF